MDAGSSSLDRIRACFPGVPYCGKPREDLQDTGRADRQEGNGEKSEQQIPQMKLHPAGEDMPAYPFCRKKCSCDHTDDKIAQEKPDSEICHITASCPPCPLREGSAGHQSPMRKAGRLRCKRRALP